MSKADPIEISLTAIRAERHNLEREREDAISAAAAPFRDRIEELTRAEAALEPLVARRDEAPTPPADPPKGGRRQGSRRKDSPPESPTPASNGSTAKARGRRNREAVLAFIRAHPGCSRIEIVRGTGVPTNSIGALLNRLISGDQGAKNPIRAEGERRQRRYFPAEMPLLPPDADGVKTGDERKIVDVLDEADGPLPPGEIAIRAKVRSDHVPQICQKLTQRGVIERIPPKREGLPPRYQPIRKLEDAISDLVA